MKCFSCKEELSEKFKYALSQNVCPFCGRGIFSPIDFHFRKSIVAILNKNGIVSETVILGVIGDIEELVRSPMPDGEPGEIVLPSRVGGNGGSTTSVSLNATTINADNIDAMTLEETEIKPTSEEEAEIQSMIDKGELVFSGVMDTTNTRRTPVRIGGKPIPRPITRAS